jgi:uncharacterized small protein (DUF1192 family)
MKRIKHNDNEGMENIKTIDSLEKEIWDLKKEIDRLNEYVQNLEMIDKQHQDLNGKLQIEINRLKGEM